MLIRLHGSPRVITNGDEVHIEYFSSTQVMLEIDRGLPSAVARPYASSGAVQLTLGSGGAFTVPTLPQTTRTISPATLLVFRGPGALQVTQVPGPYPVSGPPSPYRILSFSGALVSIDAGASILPFTAAELGAATTLDWYSSGDPGAGPDRP